MSILQDVQDQTAWGAGVSALVASRAGAAEKIAVEVSALDRAALLEAARVLIA